MSDDTPRAIRSLANVVFDPRTGEMRHDLVVISTRDRIEMEDGGPIPERLLGCFGWDEGVRHTGVVHRFPREVPETVDAELRTELKRVEMQLTVRGEELEALRSSVSLLLGEDKVAMNERLDELDPDNELDNRNGIDKIRAALAAALGVEV